MQGRSCNRGCGRKGDKQTYGLMENAVMQLHGIIGTIKCHIERTTQHAVSDNSQVLRLTDTMRAIAWHAATSRIRCVWREGAGKTTFNSSTELNEHQVQIWHLAWTEGVFRACEVGRLEQKDRWDREMINDAIGMPRRLADDGQWTVDILAVRVDLVPSPPMPFDGVRAGRGRNHQSGHRGSLCHGVSVRMRGATQTRMKSDRKRIQIDVAA